MISGLSRLFLFLSTPSARRATAYVHNIKVI